MKKLMILVSIFSATFLLISCAALERSSLLETQGNEEREAFDPNAVADAAPTETPVLEFSAEGEGSVTPPPPGEVNSTLVPAAAPPPPPPASAAVPGNLTLPPGTPLAPRKIRVVLIPPDNRVKVNSFYIDFMDPPDVKFPPPAINELTFTSVKPGKKYYLNFGFTSKRWLVNNPRGDMYGRILISINDGPLVEFTSANVELPDGAHHNMVVYVP